MSVEQYTNWTPKDFEKLSLEKFFKILPKGLTPKMFERSFSDLLFLKQEKNFSSVLSVGDINTIVYDLIARSYKIKSNLSFNLKTINSIMKSRNSTNKRNKIKALKATKKAIRLEDGKIKLLEHLLLTIKYFGV